MKKVAVIVVAMILAVVVAGCGGGDPAATETSGTPVPGAVSATGTPPPAPEPDKVVPRAFEKTPTTPDFFVEALIKQMPIVVLFYGEDDISQDLLAETKKLNDDKYYGGGAVFLLMRIDENNQIKKLARDFSIGYIPYVAVLNRSGQIIFEKNGYVDDKVLEQAVYDAMNKL